MNPSSQNAVADPAPTALVAGQAWLGALATLALPDHGGDALTFSVLDREIGFACTQIQAAAHALVDGGIRLGCALYLMKHTGAWREHGYESFEDYCRRRHRIAPRTAQSYMRPVEQFGDRLPALLTAYDEWRVMLLADVYRLNPDVFQLLTDGPAGETRAHQMSAAEFDDLIRALREENARLARDLQAVTDERDRERVLGRTLTDRLARIEHQVRDLVQSNAAQGRELERLTAENQRLRRQVRDQAAAAGADFRELSSMSSASAAAPSPPRTASAPPSAAHALPMDSLASVPLTDALDPETTSIGAFLGSLVGLQRHVHAPFSPDLHRLLESWSRQASPSVRRLLIELTALVLEASTPDPESDERLVAQALRRLNARR